MNYLYKLHLFHYIFKCITLHRIALFNIYVHSEYSIRLHKVFTYSLYKRIC